MLREGVAAWMKLAAVEPATVTLAAPTDDKEGFAATPIPDGLGADVALVLASMVMTTPQERCA